LDNITSEKSLSIRIIENVGVSYFFTIIVFIPQCLYYSFLLHIIVDTERIN
jgi:hypothetical protein